MIAAAPRAGSFGCTPSWSRNRSRVARAGVISRWVRCPPSSRTASSSRPCSPTSSCWSPRPTTRRRTRRDSTSASCGPTRSSGSPWAPASVSCSTGTPRRRASRRTSRSRRRASRGCATWWPTASGSPSSRARWPRRRDRRSPCTRSRLHRSCGRSGSCTAHRWALPPPRAARSYWSAPPRKPSEQVQGLGGPLLHEEVPGVDGRAAHVGGPLAPDVERVLRPPADHAVLAPDDQGGHLDLAVDVGAVVLQVDRRARPVVLQHRVPGVGVGEAALVLGQRLRCEHRRGRCPTRRAGRAGSRSGRRRSAAPAAGRAG